MVCASVNFHPNYGLSLNIIDIDPVFTVGNRELVVQNVILIVPINNHIMTVILRYFGPFYDVPKHVYEVPKLRSFSRTSENGMQISGRIGEIFLRNLVLSFRP